MKVHGFDIHAICLLYTYYPMLWKSCSSSPISLDWSVIEACLEYNRYEGRAYVQLI